ncbi:DUF4214 domain-containing protein [Paenibacillus gorillae]|uniref:DUF4214 domain-containing protein n=1 Tax=Paenibacillus gorillae TaxID=1243662 RepID=UPI0004B7CF48|nr:DUF4214 domain-containing protein [Paenibacillus gorillae]
MKRKGNRKRGSIKRGSQSRKKRRKHARPGRLLRKSGKGRRKGRRGRKGRKGYRRRLARTRTRKRAVNIGFDAVRLRTSNESFKKQLPAGGRIIDWFREMFKLDHDEFLWELYRQILQREPDAAGFHDHKQRLGNGTAKVWIAASIIQSQEAEDVFGRGPSGEANTAAHVFQHLFPAADLDFIHAAHVHIMLREPEAERVASYAATLRQGGSVGYGLRGYCSPTRHKACWPPQVRRYRKPPDHPGNTGTSAFSYALGHKFQWTAKALADSLPGCRKGCLPSIKDICCMWRRQRRISKRRTPFSTPCLNVLKAASKFIIQTAWI